MPIPALHTRVLLHTASKHGASTEDLLRAVGIGSVPTGASDTLPTRLHAQLYDLARERTGNPEMGLLMGQEASSEHFDIIGFALRSAATIGAALEMANQFHQHIAPHLGFRIVDEGEVCGWAIEPLEERSCDWATGEIEYLLSMFLTAVDEIAGHPVPVVSVSFRHRAVAPARVYEARFRAPVAFSQPRNELLLPRELLDTPSCKAEPALSAVLRRYSDELRRSFATRASTAAFLRAEIGRNLRDIPSQQELADKLEISVRTLQNRLKQRGLSYRGLVEQIRRDKASHLLAEGRLSVARTAAELGYRDARAFRRAFRRWHGCSPESYRRRARDG